MNELYNKIQKLLSLGTGSVQGNEAEVALKMANDLMQKHNITMSELNAASREEELGKLEKFSNGDKAYKIWERILMSSLAKLFDCRVVMSSLPGTTRKTMYIVGRESNTRTAQLMYNWIHDKTMQEARERFGSKTSMRNSYCVGVAQAISNKVLEMKKENDKTDNGWGLVAINEVDQFMKAEFGALTRSRSRLSASDNRAAAAGYSEGEKIGLNRQFGLKAIGA